MNELFEQALKAEGITGQLADLARSIYMQESGGGKNTKTSNRGAVGGMQILEGTFKEVADKGWNINDPLHNARAGIRYIRDRYEQAKGDPRLAAIGYYGGPGAINAALKGQARVDPQNPKAPNTFQYGDQVVARMGQGKTSQAQLVQEPQMPVQQAEVEPVPVADRLPVDAPVVPVVAQIPQGDPVYRTAAEDAWMAFQKQHVKPLQTADFDYQPLIEANGRRAQPVMPVAAPQNKVKIGLIQALKGFA